MEALKYCHMSFLISVTAVQPKYWLMDVYLPFALLNTYVFISTRTTINKIFSFHLGESQTYLISALFFTALI